MTAVTSCADETVERDVQTEELGAEHKAQQAPDDKMINDQPTTNRVHAGAQRKAAKNEALQLEKFMSRAGPVVEQLIEENEQLRFISNRQQATQRNAVEPKSLLKFPNEILLMLGSFQQ